MVLFSSHQLELVEELCRDAVIVADGRCVAAGDVAELRARSPHRTVQITFTEPVGGTAERGRWSAPTAAASSSLSTTTSASTRPWPRRAPTAPVEAFSYAPPDLSDLFRELVS